jgi:hypothetical protein
VTIPLLEIGVPAPFGEHARVLGLLEELGGGPVAHGTLAWHLRGQSEQVFASTQAKREHLFVVLGDLEDAGLVTTGMQGMSLSGKGRDTCRLWAALASE